MKFGILMIGIICIIPGFCCIGCDIDAVRTGEITYQVTGADPEVEKIVLNWYPSGEESFYYEAPLPWEISFSYEVKNFHPVSFDAKITAYKYRGLDAYIKKVDPDGIITVEILVDGTVVASHNSSDLPFNTFAECSKSIRLEY